MTGNLSTAILLGGIVLILWFLARIPWKYILSTIGIAIVLLVAGYAIVEFGFVRSGKTIERGPFKRAITWVNRVDDIFAEHADDSAEFKLTDDNYQRSIAKVAVARGGRSPFGVLPGNSQERDYLPQAFADYIFAIIVEESGVFGALVLIFIYMAVLFRACQTSSRFGDYAALLMVMGLALMLTCQALVSMMVAVGLGPVTGQPLPLISRGGTSALITSAYFGIIMSVSREQRELSERQNITTKESLEDVPEITLE
jgi:cell division protein FtsW